MEKRERTNLVFFAALCAGLLCSAASCKKDGGDNAAPVTETAFTATAESHKGDGKTYLEDYKVLWEPNDEIAVYNGSGVRGLFQAETGGEDKTDFKEVVGNVPEGFYEDPYTAVYPSKVVSAEGAQENTSTTLHLPQSQAYKANGFGMDVNPMTAKSDTKTLAFKNACGLLELQLTGLFKVTKIAVESADASEQLWGDCAITVADGGVPTITGITNGDNTVELNCGSTGVQLDAHTATPFYILVPAETLDDGFTVTVTFDNGGTESFSAGAYTPGSGVEGTNRIVRSQIREMPAKYASMGALPGEFSVSPDKKVHFSKGNLQYVKSTETWRFAEDQWETVERSGQDVGEDYINQTVVGLFGWATSGKAATDGTPTPPYTTSSTATYGPTLLQYQNFSYEYDWGCNAISNGGNKEGLWRVLQCHNGDATATEWEYLINGRKTDEKVNHSYAKVTVAGMAGLMLFPDGFDFTWPDNAGTAPTGYDSPGTSASPIGFTQGSYTADQFGVLESLGVVFLPCAGHRNGSMPGNSGLTVHYLSSTAKGTSRTYTLYCSHNGVTSANDNASANGFAVRLVLK